PKFGRRGAGKKSLFQVWGEGFRVRAKTTVLNIDEVYLNLTRQNKGHPLVFRHSVLVHHGVNRAAI
ncbi:hypothetical protein, partial [uncultured Nostoc sp.]|uniref:hypothetical protein n=1 Tax=uncultured Nostoc sp. TaxID=340711 RepID=UPI00260B268B